MPTIQTKAPDRKTKAPAFDAVVFDIDNVLIDTRRSYTDAIRWTVEMYLTEGSVPLFRPMKRSSDPMLLTAKDVDEFKLLGGFNDDWDCCYGLLVYLISLPIKKRNLDRLKQVMSIKKLAQKVKTRPLRITGITKMFGRPPGITIEKISRIFQEVYLGKELFQSIEKKEPEYWNKRGLIFNERLVFKRPLLEKIKNLGVQLGIATGRSRFEAVYALRHFNVLDLFDTMTPMDEVKKAEKILKQSLRKPHPYSIIETAKKLGVAKRYLYIGDLPDDVLAANEAKNTLQIHSAVYPNLSQSSKSSLQEVLKAKPDFLLQKPVDLLPIVKRGIQKKPR